MATKNEKGFLVRFEDVGGGKRNWEERIGRPVTDAKIVAAVKREKALKSTVITAHEHSDYGGMIFAHGASVGSYFIVPGSEK